MCGGLGNNGLISYRSNGPQNPSPRPQTRFVYQVDSKTPGEERPNFQQQHSVDAGGVAIAFCGNLRQGTCTSEAGYNKCHEWRHASKLQCAAASV